MAAEKNINAKTIGTDYTFTHKIVWRNVAAYAILHVLALWGVWRVITGCVPIKSIIWFYFLGGCSSQGTLMGAHRLYSHKSFSATPVLRAFVVLFQTLAGQNSMYTWCRDHRVHHRYSDTDADPHNAKRGFFFSHVGWLLTKKHPYVTEYGKAIDMSDLEADWMVMFQKKYYIWLYIVFAIFTPIFVPIYFWRDNFANSLSVCFCLRYAYELNVTWLVNSAAHLYGTRPYDKNLQPVEAWLVSFLTFGEGWHNYHHAFPWDYRAAELSMRFNSTASIIRLLNHLGLAYDLKTASPEMIARRIIQTGDGTHHTLDHNEVKAIRSLRYDNTKCDLVKDIREAYVLPQFNVTDVVYMSSDKRNDGVQLSNVS